MISQAPSALRVAGKKRRDRLARFRPQQFSVAIDAGPIAVDELHRVPAGPAFRRRAFIDHGKIRQFKIIVIRNRHIAPIYAPWGFIFSCNAFSAL